MRRTPKENLNQGFINLIRKAHGLIENTDIEKHRHSQDQMGALFGNNREVEVTETTVGSMYAEWIRVDRPHSGKKIILYCHGGGYSTGSPLYARTLTTKLASLLSMDVFCFDYRLAPEHPYPAAVDDAQAAWDYLMLQGYGAKDIFVAGDSAGGNLALALGLRLKEQKRMLPAGFVLMSPWTDLTVSGKTHETKADVDPVLNQNYLNEMIENYVPQAKKYRGRRLRICRQQGLKKESRGLNRLAVILKNCLIQNIYRIRKFPRCLETSPDSANLHSGGGAGGADVRFHHAAEEDE